MHKSVNIFCISLIVLFISSFQAVAEPALSEENIKYLFRNIQDPKADIKIADVYKALYVDNIGLKQRAVTYLGKNGDVNSIPYLIDALLEKHSNNSARKALKKLTNEDFGFNWNSSLETKRETIKKWNNWIKEKDEMIKKALTYAKKQRLDLSGYEIYRVHTNNPEKTKWSVSFISSPPGIRPPEIIIDKTIDKSNKDEYDDNVIKYNYKINFIRGK